MEPFLNRAETALVTGANRGIGLALVGELLQRDFRVIAGVRDLASASKLRGLASTDQLLVVRLDVSNAGSVEQARDEAANWTDKLDLLFNNAAVLPEEGDERILRMNPEWFMESYRVNVVGAVRVVQDFLPLLQLARHPRILNISSRAGSIEDQHGWSYYAYGASKAALNMFTKSLANELRNDNISVVSVSPGWVRTDMGGEQAPLAAEDSAKSLVDFARKLDMQQTGTFVDRTGELQIPW